MWPQTKGHKRIHEDVMGVMWSRNLTWGDKPNEGSKLLMHWKHSTSTNYIKWTKVIVTCSIQLEDKNISFLLVWIVNYSYYYYLFCLRLPCLSLGLGNSRPTTHNGRPTHNGRQPFVELRVVRVRITLSPFEISSFLPPIPFSHECLPLLIHPSGLDPLS